VETKYLVRTLVQNLRVGANWRSIVGALAKATLLHRRVSISLTASHQSGSPNPRFMGKVIY